MNLYEACLEKFGVITAVMILADFSGFMADFNRANEEELKELIAPLNKDKDTDQIKSFVLEETGVETFGISTIGQAMLTAYAAYANSYVAFKHSFNMLVSGEEYEENQVMAFWGLYADNTDFQHIDFHIMFYDNAFHSIYTIKSSMSLILFEAAHDYPVLEYDTASKAVFQPGNGKKCFPAKAVFAFLGDEVENYAHTHDGIQIDEFESATRRYPIYECLYNQEKICLCPAPVGSAAAVQVLEYLIAGGVTKIISVGSCGVLEDIPENRFLIPVSALRDEGTSYHYLPPSREVEISKAGINAIESALSQKNIPYWEVKTWTTDGFYRETVEMVQYRKEEGCQVVEMECSALAACAKFRKVTWAMLLFSADTLADPHKYQEREWGKTSISIALELALDAVLSVVEE